MGWEILAASIKSQVISSVLTVKYSVRFDFRDFGAGKGMATKHEIISTKLKEADSDTEIIIVDPENEYSIIGQAFGGESIDMPQILPIFLNV